MLKTPPVSQSNVPSQPVRARHHVGYFAPCSWEVQGPKAHFLFARGTLFALGGSEHIKVRGLVLRQSSATYSPPSKMHILRCPLREDRA